MDDLAQRLEATARRFSGRVGYALANLATGEQVFARADEVFPTASAVKLPALTAFHAFVDQGNASWSQSVEITRADIPGGSGVLQHLTLPRTISFQDAAWLMICVSDNLATNLLLRAMTIERTNDLIRRTIGDGIVINGFAGFRPGLAVPSMGQATPRALLAYLQSLAEERLPGSVETVAVLRMQSDHTMIPRYLPVNAYGESPVRLANKTGSLAGVRVDIGLLQSPSTTIAMVFMTADGADTGFTFTNEGEECIGQLARTVWKTWVGGRPTPVPARLRPAQKAPHAALRLRRSGR